MSGRSRLLIVLLIPVFATGLLVIIGNVAVERTNPPVRYTIEWDSPETERLARAACFDCHSHETRWPWYAHVAPASFFLANHVQEGREAMNFSLGYNLDAEEMIEEIEEGTMPPAVYLPLHPEANLTAEQQAQLAEGLRATFGRRLPIFGRGGS